MPEDIEEQVDDQVDQPLQLWGTHEPARGVPIWMEQQDQTQAQMPPRIRMQFPTTPVTTDEASQLVAAYTQLERQQEAAQKAALTYQRQMKYTQMVQQGVDPAKALWDSGLWMNYTHPGPMSQIAKSMTGVPLPQAGQSQLWATPAYDPDTGELVARTIDVGGKTVVLRIPKPTAEKAEKPTPQQANKVKAIEAGISATQNRISKAVEEGDSENQVRLQSHLDKLQKELDEVYTPKAAKEIQTPEIPNYQPEPSPDAVPRGTLANFNIPPSTPVQVHPDPTNTPGILPLEPALRAPTNSPVVPPEVRTPVAPAQAMTAPAPAQTQATPRKVRVKSPKGKIGWIPEYQLDQALAEGYTPVD